MKHLCLCADDSRASLIDLSLLLRLQVPLILFTRSTDLIRGNSCSPLLFLVRNGSAA